jgi:hypothetical protein
MAAKHKTPDEQTISASGFAVLALEGAAGMSVVMVPS